jgi:hypothetical protein
MSSDPYGFGSATSTRAGESANAPPDQYAETGLPMPSPSAPSTHNDRLWANPDNWSEALYFSKADTRLCVPKRISWTGWTLNFGHPRAHVGGRSVPATHGAGSCANCGIYYQCSLHPYEVNRAWPTLRLQWWPKLLIYAPHIN